MIEKKIVILIHENTKYGEFHDAIYFTEDEHAALSEKEIESLVAARVDTHIQSIEIKAPVVFETKEVLEARKVELQSEISDIDARLTKK